MYTNSGDGDLGYFRRSPRPVTLRSRRVDSSDIRDNRREALDQESSDTVTLDVHQRITADALSHSDESAPCRGPSSRELCGLTADRLPKRRSVRPDSHSPSGRNEKPRQSGESGRNDVIGWRLVMRRLVLMAIAPIVGCWDGTNCLSCLLKWRLLESQLSVVSEVMPDGHGGRNRRVGLIELESDSRFGATLVGISTA